MRLVQKKGPFSKGSSFQAGGTNANEFVHIGIHLPKTQPISENLYNTNRFDNGHNSSRVEFKTLETTSLSPDIQLTTVSGASTFYINELGILEFDGTVGTAVTVKFLKDLPAETVIDLVYKQQGE